MALGLGKRRAQEGQNLFLLISLEIETGTWNYFLMKIKHTRGEVIPPKEMIYDLEWRMEARWIFRIISDLYKGSQASGRHRERQVLDSVDKQLDQASPEVNILWNFQLHDQISLFYGLFSPTFFFCCCLGQNKQTKNMFESGYLSCVTKRFLTNTYPLPIVLTQLLVVFYFSFICYGNIHFYFSSLWVTSILLIFSSYQVSDTTP